MHAQKTSQLLKFISRQTAIKLGQKNMFQSAFKMGQLHSKNLMAGVTIIPSRTFASLPSHMKLDMPNLSPTMEKVGFFILSYFVSGKYWSMEKECRRQDPAG
jgi:hypothetical protein